MSTHSPLNNESEASSSTETTARNGLIEFFKKAYTLLKNRAILVLLCLASIGIFLLCVGYYFVSTTVIETMALQEAKRASKIMTEVRSLYTSEVVARLNKYEVLSTHNYKTHPGSIPLPATFSILLGQRLAESESQAQIRLFSDHPFPWRTDGGPKDGFERAAWQQLQVDPAQVFYQFDKDASGTTILRYATADVMREDCVACHNTYPDSPKTDWKVGDVRGVLEVVQPLDNVVIELQHIIQGLFVIIVLGTVGAGGVALVILKLRHHRTELEKSIAERTSTLTQANQEMDRLITKHKAAETKFRTLLEAAPEAMVIVNDQGKIALVNARTEQLLGYGREELLGTSIEILVPEDLREAHQSHRGEYTAAMREQRMAQGREVLARCKNGTECSVEIGLAPLETQEGKLVLASIRDISGRKKAAEELKAAYAHTEQLLNAISLILIGVNEEGTITRWNSQAESVLEIGHQETVGQSFWDFPIRWDTDTVSKGVEQALKTKQMVHFEDLRVLSPKSGQERTLRLSITPILLKQDSVGGFLLLGDDVTESREHEEEIKQLHQLNDQILRSAGEGIFGLDLQGMTSFVNPATAQMLGYEVDELVGVPMHATVHHTETNGSPYPQEKCPMDATIHDGVERRIANEVLWRKDGTCFAVEYTSTPIYNNDILAGAVITFRDISSRKQLEAQLNLAQKMESIGQLAAGIAHEINTPTQFVSDNLRFLQDSFAGIQSVLAVYGQLVQALPVGGVDPHLLETVEATVAEADLEYAQEEIPKALQQSLEGANRVAKIVRAMKDFSHPGAEEKKPIDLNKAIESTVTVARNEWKYVADLVTEFDPSLPLVPCLPGEFNQVILNLLVNAAHAIGDVVRNEEGQKGTITISTKREGDWAEVRIADTGTGIPEAARNKIFDPFFTTKDVGKGTGQGMAIAHDVMVNKHGGILVFDTEMGVGTTFLIQLPLQGAPAPQEVR